MKIQIYATLIFSFKLEDFQGSNFHALKAIEELDNNCIECRGISFKIEPEKIKMSVDLLAEFDDLGLGEKQIFDEDEARDWFEGKLNCDFMFLFDADNSELSERFNTQTCIDTIENGLCLFSMGQIEPEAQKELNRRVRRKEIAKIKTMWPWRTMGIKKTGYCLPHLANHYSTQ